MIRAKIIIVTIIVVGLSILNLMFARKVGNMPEVSKFEELFIYKNYVYAIDYQVHVDIYSLNPFRYIKQASRYGSGPGETIIFPCMVIYPDHFCLYRLGKCMFFTHNGDYIKEFRISKPQLYLFAPIGENYLTHSITQDQTNAYHELSICSYTEKEGIQHKKVVYIYTSPHKKKKNNKIPYSPYGECRKYAIKGDRIFVPDSTRGMFAEIYDFNGNRISRIQLDYEKIKVPEDNKKKVKEDLESIAAFKATDDYYFLDFPEYYPPFQYATLDNGKVYFVTFYKKGQMREIYIADWKGKFIKRAYVSSLIDLENMRCVIADNKFYYVYENEETEEWELHAEDIK